MRVIQGIIIRNFFLFLFIFNEVFGSADPSISFVHVGQGNCIIIDCANGEKLLVDCGQSKLPHIGDERSKTTNVKLAAAIKKQYLIGGEKPAILITHPDKDHLNLLSGIFEDNSSFGQIPLILGGPLEDYFKTGTNWKLIQHFSGIGSPIVSLSHTLSDYDMRELIGIMHSTITPIHSDLKKYKDETERLVAESHAASAAIRVSRKQGLNSIKKRWENAVDDEFKKFRRNLQGHILGSKLGVAVPLLGGFCNKFDIEILSANAGQGSFLTKQRSQAHAVINKDDNTNSVVLKVTHKKGRQSAILTGDARGVTTDQIILYNDGPGVPLRTDVMLACHHGADSHESNNKEWIEVTNPKSTILSCGHRADYLHPMCNVVEAYVSKAAIHGTEVTSHKITCGESSVFTGVFKELCQIRKKV